MNRAITVSLIALSLSATTSKLAAQSFSLTGDFSTTTNPNGAWSYGFTPTLGSTFTAFSLVEDWRGVGPYTQIWHNSSVSPDSYPGIEVNASGSTISDIRPVGGSFVMPTGAVALEPGPSAADEYAVARLTIPTGAVYSVSVSFSGASTTPTTTDIHVLRNSVSLFDGTINAFNETYSFSDSLSLASGDTLDFAVGNGNGQNFGDQTFVTATITVVPEPTEYAAIAGLGLFAFAAVRRFYRA